MQLLKKKQAKNTSVKNILSILKHILNRELCPHALFPFCQFNNRYTSSYNRGIFFYK